MKRKYSTFIILCITMMMLFLNPADVKAAYDYQNPGKIYTCGNFEYAYDTQTGYIWITNYTGNEEVVVVPSEINGVPVKHIASFYDLKEICFDDELKDKVKKIILPEGIESIAYLRCCVNLEEINLPETLKVIDSDTFAYCKKLRNVKLPSTLEKIGESCFNSCESLESIQIPGSVKEINIPDSVTEIGDSAFFCCKKLTKVKLSKELRVIEGFAFAITGLKSVTIPQNVKKIESYVFSTTNISKVTIPKKVDYIGVGAFKGCKKLKNITIKGTRIKTIRKEAFTGIHPKAVFNVPNKSIEKYKKFLENKKIYDGKRLNIK